MQTLLLIFTCKGPKYVDDGGVKICIIFCGSPWQWPLKNTSAIEIFGCVENIYCTL